MTIKSIALGLALGFTTWVSTPEVEVEVSSQWTDVPSSYIDSVSYMQSKGYTGKSPISYGTDDFLTRDEIITMVGKVSGVEEEERKVFPDSSNPYLPQLAELGIVHGTAEGKFNPDSLVKRIDTLRILSRAFDVTQDPDFNRFRDVPKKDLSMVGGFVSSGYINGTSYTTLGTDSPIKRGDLGKILYGVGPVNLYHYKINEDTYLIFGDKRVRADYIIIPGLSGELSDYHLNGAYVKTKQDISKMDILYKGVHPVTWKERKL